MDARRGERQKHGSSLQVGHAHMNAGLGPRTGSGSARHEKPSGHAAEMQRSGETPLSSYPAVYVPLTTSRSGKKSHKKTKSRGRNEQAGGTSSGRDGTTSGDVESAAEEFERSEGSGASLSSLNVSGRSISGRALTGPIVDAFASQSPRFEPRPKSGPVGIGGHRAAIASSALDLHTPRDKKQSPFFGHKVGAFIKSKSGNDVMTSKAWMRGRDAREAFDPTLVNTYQNASSSGVIDDADDDDLCCTIDDLDLHTSLTSAKQRQAVTLSATARSQASSAQSLRPKQRTSSLMRYQGMGGSAASHQQQPTTSLSALAAQQMSGGERSGVSMSSPKHYSRSANSLPHTKSRGRLSFKSISSLGSLGIDVDGHVSSPPKSFVMDDYSDLNGPDEFHVLGVEWVNEPRVRKSQKSLSFSSRALPRVSSANRLPEKPRLGGEDRRTVNPSTQRAFGKSGSGTTGGGSSSGGASALRTIASASSGVGSGNGTGPGNGTGTGNGNGNGNGNRNGNGTGIGPGNGNATTTEPGAASTGPAHRKSSIRESIHLFFSSSLRSMHGSGSKDARAANDS
ncbi:hypothetical protein FVE85_0578 [Porphyridium purpureum]|uniref:Uncharacterized protein n=1 Tax=Porphyridium purpureum TaxID=35688 RepID=A0A5J4YYZ9_PORPP|nr:hypothetical protein FVE85_0578 [Porphyridium purpureum]|eukprot:POR4851..scf208_2